MKRALGALKAREFEPEIPRHDRRQHQLRIVLDPLHQIAGNVVDDVRFAALQHRHTGCRIGDAQDREALDVHRAVIAGESLEFELRSRLLPHHPVRTGANRRLHEARLPDLLIILCRNHPGGAADIRRSHQPDEVEKRLFEAEAKSAVVEHVDVVGAVLQNLGPGAMVALVAPDDIGRGDGAAVVEL